MADEAVEEPGLVDSVMEKITEKFQDSSDSDSEISSASSLVRGKVFRLFGREKPVHKVLGGGKPADIFLWRDKKVSGSVVGGATVLWLLFEVIEYHLLTLLCHFLILAFSVLFLWSNASTFINKPPPQIPEVQISDDTIIRIVSGLRFEINRALTIIRDIASGRDLKKFLAVIAGLWVISVIGCWLNFVTLLYLGFVLLHSMPIFYEKYEDEVDSFAEKALVEFKKQYEVFDAKVLSKLPVGALKDKKVT